MRRCIDRTDLCWMMLTTFKYENTFQTDTCSVKGFQSRNSSCACVDGEKRTCLSSEIT